MTDNQTQEPLKVELFEAKEDARNRNVGGSMYEEFNDELLNQIARVITQNASLVPTVKQSVAAMAGIAPQNEMEAMLAAQMVATHQAVMTCYRRGSSSELSIELAQFHYGFANKLSRTFTMQVDAMQRLKGQTTQQKMTVEHVHVHAGGQAIVGNVERPALTGGKKKGKVQAHAKQNSPKQITHAPQPAMPRPDTQKELLPIPSDA